MKLSWLLMVVLTCVTSGCGGDEDETTAESAEEALSRQEQAARNDLRRFASGEESACYLTRDGGVRCFGLRGNGQLGQALANDADGFPLPGVSPRVPATESVTPIGLEQGGFKQIAGSGIGHMGVGNSTFCALSNAGGVTCWGGYVGLDYAERQFLARPIDGLTAGIKAIAVSSDVACAIGQAGGVKCWNLGWQDEPKVPTQVAGLESGVETVFPGVGGGCALMTAGALRCWTGAGPAEVIAGFEAGIKALAFSFDANPFTAESMPSRSDRGGRSHPMCVVSKAGALKCGKRPESLRVVPGFETGIANVSIAGLLGCVLTTTGGIKCRDTGGGAEELATRATEPGAAAGAAPFVLGMSSGMRALSIGGTHACAFGRDGKISCWGHVALRDARELGFPEPRTIAPPAW